MKEWQSSAHVKWECKYHIVIVPKYRRKVLFGKTRKKVGEVLNVEEPTLTRTRNPGQSQACLIVRVCPLRGQAGYAVVASVMKPCFRSILSQRGAFRATVSAS